MGIDGSARRKSPTADRIRLRPHPSGRVRKMYNHEMISLARAACDRLGIAYSTVHANPSTAPRRPLRRALADHDNELLLQSFDNCRYGRLTLRSFSASVFYSFNSPIDISARLRNDRLYENLQQTSALRVAGPNRFCDE